MKDTVQPGTDTTGQLNEDQPRSEWDAMTPEQQNAAYKQNVRALLFLAGSLCDNIDALADIIELQGVEDDVPSPGVLAGRAAKTTVAQIRADYDLVTLLAQIKAKVEEEKLGISS